MQVVRDSYYKWMLNLELHYAVQHTTGYRGISNLNIFPHIVLPEFQTQSECGKD